MLVRVYRYVIRIGARPVDVLRDAMAPGVLVICVGTIVGLAVAFAAKQLLSSFLFGIRSMDFASFGEVSAGKMVVALIACYLPARRAAKVDPIITLRQD